MRDYRSSRTADPSTDKQRSSLDDEEGYDREAVQARSLWLINREVQRLAAGSATAKDEGAVQETAAAGVAGTGTELPHREQIQAAFGPHDISHVRAHVGGDAAQAAGAIGAQAYATGDDVAFAAAPDLHTAAHEAAHVVQQRQGVHLKGGVGQAGDAYEQQADAVADQVVRGESAAHLLSDQSVHIGDGDRRTPPVQRKEAAEDPLLDLARRADPHASRGGARPIEEQTPEEKAGAEQLLAENDYKRALTAAQVSGRRTLAALAMAPAAAVEIGKDGCVALADHLGMVRGSGRAIAGSASSQVLDVMALVHQLVDRMAQLGAGDLPEVEALATTMADVQALAPDESVRNRTFVSGAAAMEVSDASDGRVAAASPSRDLGRHLEVAANRLHGAVELFRIQLVGKEGDVTQKEAILRAAVDDVSPWIDYVARTIDRNDLGTSVGDQQLHGAARAFRDAAQRFVYWAVYDPAAKEVVEAVSRPVDRVSAQFGLDPLKLAGPTGDETDRVMSGAVTRYVTAWRAVYEAQRLALQGLIDSEEKKQESGGWDSALFAALGAAGYAGIIGYVVGGAVDKLKGGAKTAASDTMKSLAKTVFATKSATPSTNNTLRQRFFYQRQLALVDLEKQHMEEFAQRDALEAKRNPDVAAGIEAEAEAAQRSAADVQARYQVESVMDWATTMAGSRYGKNWTGGVDLDNAGAFEDHATGVMEITARMSKPGKRPAIERAVVGSLRNDDAARLHGQRVGDLTMPIQVQGRFESMVPPAFVISRNQEGTVWLGETTDEGKAWLEERGRGDALEGARLLFEDMSVMVVDPVGDS
jgi:hypothetical protein